VRYARVLSKQFAFVARFDIRSYYQSIDHRVMLAILSASGVSRDVFNVVQDYLCKPDVQRTGKGMVAGGSISPLLGAVYLAPLDRAMAGLCQQGSIRYQRFMDDYVIFAKTRHKLKAAIKRMVAVLGALQLEVHPDKRYIGKTEKGFYFLGYRFGPQKLLEPAAQSLARLIERARRLQEKGADSHRLRQCNRLVPHLSQQHPVGVQAHQVGWNRGDFWCGQAHACGVDGAGEQCGGAGAA
jgi:hypothetical protein